FWEGKLTLETSISQRAIGTISGADFDNTAGHFPHRISTVTPSGLLSNCKKQVWDFASQVDAAGVIRWPSCPVSTVSSGSAGSWMRMALMVRAGLLTTKR